MLQEPKMSYQLIPNRAGRGRRGFKPKLIVLHIQQGTGPLGKYFAGVDADSTAWVGYLGQAERYLYDTDEAWTDGSWTEPVNHSDPAIQAVYNDTEPRGMNSNVEALTIEYEGFPGQPLTAAQIETSAQIIAYWCQKWSIPCDRQHIVGHYEVGEHKNCPGPNFPFDQIIARSNAILAADNGGGATPVNSKPFSSVNLLTGKFEQIVVQNEFLDFFNTHGGIAIFGLPVTPEVDAADFKLPYQGSCQWFERARFEFHDDAKAVMLGRVGAELLQKPVQLN